MIAGITLFAFALHVFVITLAARSAEAEWDRLAGLYGICHSPAQPQAPLPQDDHDPLACCFHHCCSLSSGSIVPALNSLGLAPEVLAVAIVFDGGDRAASHRRFSPEARPRAPPTAV
jgi:hypothetical protein